MNCIVIDDDSFARKLIDEYIRRTKPLVLLHSLSSAMEAIDVLSSNEIVDLIFLDIEMPGMSGIDFLNSLSTLPQIIIISAKEKYAVNAFDYDITDYLLKPVPYNRFIKAVNKALERQKNDKIHSAGTEIYIRQKNSLVKIKYSDIIWVEAMENYIVIYTIHEKYTLSFTMHAIEEKLPPKMFIRIHRSFIVNIAEIHSIEEKVVHVKTGNDSINCIPLGKMYREKLLKVLNVISK